MYAYSTSGACVPGTVRLRPDTCTITSFLSTHEYKIKIFKLYTKEREPTDCPSHCFVM